MTDLRKVNVSQHLWCSTERPLYLFLYLNFGCESQSRSRPPGWFESTYRKSLQTNKNNVICLHEAATVLSLNSIRPLCELSLWWNNKRLSGRRKCWARLSAQWITVWRQRRHSCHGEGQNDCRWLLCSIWWAFQLVDSRVVISLSVDVKQHNPTTSYLVIFCLDFPPKKITPSPT